MKSMIIKLKKEVEELKQKASQQQQIEHDSNERIQHFSMQIDDLKMQVSESVREKEKLNSDVSSNFCFNL